MKNLPAVSVKPYGSQIETSFKAQSIEHVLPGKNGYAVLLGGPTLRGSVREARAVPLGRQSHPVPAGRSPEQLARREVIGSMLMHLAKPEPGDASYESPDNEPMRPL